MMSVSLVHCTPDAEALIVRMARVSNPGNADNLETAPRLLRYLIRHRHWSPFEMAGLCVKVETERDIAAQILRHRSFSFQEFSTRYARTAPAQIPAFRRQDDSNRQASHDDLPAELQDDLVSLASLVIGNAVVAYEEMLSKGVAKECARRILPLCTPTTLYMHGTLRSWITYIAIREKTDTQLEHRTIALEIKNVFRQCFPIIHEALGGNADWEV